MGLSRENLETQLERAKDTLKAFEQVLEQRGLSPKECRREPKWRNLNAKCRTLRARLRAVSEIESRDAEAERRKTEKATAGAEG